MITTTPNKKIIERARKLYALELQGVGGERDNAKRMLDELLKCHGLTREDIQLQPLQSHEVVSRDIVVPIYSPAKETFHVGGILRHLVIQAVASYDPNISIECTSTSTNLFCIAFHVNCLSKDFTEVHRLVLYHANQCQKYLLKCYLDYLVTNSLHTH